ncbi:MAG: GGDEF domain-containing protein, partial [Pseudoxanthomonas sp.]
GLGIAVYQRVLNQRLQRLSTTDALTGLLNRRAAAARIQQLSADQQANADRRHVMLLIDIDHFKQLNDRAGHAAGDRVLVEVARRLRACCRPDDVVARWGGEEFLIACAPMSLTQASAFAERIRAGIASLDAQDTPLKITMTASVGFSCWPFLPGADPTRSGDWQDALSLADRAMYAAKHAGRNAWVGLWGKANARCSLQEALDVPQHGVAAGDIEVAASLRIAAWQPAPARAA